MESLVIPTQFLQHALDEPRRELLQLVVAAHQAAATNNPNASNAALTQAAFGSGRPENGYAAAILTLGAVHGPIRDARHTFENLALDTIAQLLGLGHKIPGFGNSFFKDQIDPAWRSVNQYLAERFAAEHHRVGLIQEAIAQAKGRVIHPNAAMFSAVACSLCHVAHGCESAVFIMARLPVWAVQCQGS